MEEEQITEKSQEPEKIKNIETDKSQPEEKSEEPKKTKSEEKKEEFLKLKEESEQRERQVRAKLKDADTIDEPEYFLMKHYLNMASGGEEFGCIISSRGGTGKTYTTLQYLEKEEKDYAYLNSFSTPLAFYIWSYRNRNKIKVIDDCHKLLESDKFAPYLKAQLESYNGKRIVCYNSTKPIEDAEGQCPPSYEENGSTIILTNRINRKNIHIDAVLTRIPLCELEISNKRMLELMGIIAKKPYKSMTTEDNMEVYKFCEVELQNSTDLNLRTFNHARKFFMYAKRIGDKDVWKRLITQSLRKDDTALIIVQVCVDDRYQTDDERIDAINKQLVTHISRATFYRKKKQLEDEIKALSAD